MSLATFSSGHNIAKCYVVCHATNPADSAGFKSAVESAAEPPTSPPESASGVESATGLVRGGHSTGPPRSRSESAADFKVRLESAGVRSESAGVRQNSFESIRNTFWRRSAGVRSESGGSAAESTPRRQIRATQLSSLNNWFGIDEISFYFIFYYFIFQIQFIFKISKPFQYIVQKVGDLQFWKHTRI